MTYRPSYASDAYDPFARLDRRLGRAVRPDDDRGTLDQAGRDLALLNYVLLALGFFTLVTAPIAVMLAYGRRHRGGALARSHLEWQIRIFWHCVLAWLAIGILHAVIAGIGALTFGVGLVFMVIPWGLGLAWLVWTVWAIARGMLLLSRQSPVT